MLLWQAGIATALAFQYKYYAYTTRYSPWSISPIIEIGDDGATF